MSGLGLGEGRPGRVPEVLAAMGWLTTAALSDGSP